MLPLSLLAQNIPRTSFLRPEPQTLPYVADVEEADGEQLEFSVKSAFNNFIRNSKVHGTWQPMRVTCLLCGARTLDGCLVPLRGPAPTAFNFSPADYDRKFGLIGDSSSNKYLDSNRGNRAEPAIDNHNAVAGTNLNTGVLMGAGISASGANFITHSSISNRNSTGISISPPLNANFFLASTRSEISTININVNGITTTVDLVRQTAAAARVFVFSRGDPDETGSQQIMFYSIGRDIDLDILYADFETLRTQIQEWIL